MLITLDEARAQLNLGADETDDDTLITDFILAAAAHLERHFGIVVDKGQRTWAFDRFSTDMYLKLTPVHPETVVVKYLDGDGVEHILAGVRCIPSGRHLLLAPAIGSTWPQAACAPGVITVSAQAGFAVDPNTSGGVPPDLKVAGRQIVAHWDLNREAAAREMTPVPIGALSLLNAYKFGGA